MWKSFVRGWLTGDADRRHMALAMIRGDLTGRLKTCPSCDGEGVTCYCLGTGTAEGYVKGIERVASELERWAGESETATGEQTFSRMAHSYREIAQEARRLARGA